MTNELRRGSEADKLEQALPKINDYEIVESPLTGHRTIEEIAVDLKEHGLRFDLNPTVMLNDPFAYINYIKRMDDRARELGEELLEALKFNF